MPPLPKSPPPNTIPHCLQCGYQLSHLPVDRCPECGRPFDPRNLHSFSVAPKPTSRHFLRLLRLPAWPFSLAALILLVRQIQRQSLPSAPPVWKIPAFFHAWIILTALWLVATILPPFAAKLRQVPAPFGPPSRRRWLPYVLFPILSLAISYFNLGFPIAFFISRPALSALVAEADANYPILDWPKRTHAGLLPVKALYSTRDGIIISITPDLALVHLHSGIPASSWGAVTPLPFADGHWFLAPNITPDAPRERAAVKWTILSDLLENPRPTGRAIALLLKLLPEAQENSVAEEAFIQYSSRMWLDQDAISVLEQGSEFPIQLDMQALARLDSAAVPALIRALHAGTPSPARCLAVLALIGSSAAPAAPHVAPFLKDPDPAIRALAASTLRQIDSPKCTQSAALLAALNDADPVVTFNILLALEASALSDADLALPYTNLWKFTIPIPPPAPANAIASKKNLENPWFNNIQLIVERLKRAQAAAAPAAPIIAAALHDLVAYDQLHPPMDVQETFPLGQYTDIEAAHEQFAKVLRPAQGELQAAEMLAGMGDSARIAAPAIAEMLRFHFRPDVPHFEMRIDLLNPPSATALFLQTLARLNPTPPEILPLILSRLQESREESIHPPIVTDKERPWLADYQPLLRAYRAAALGRAIQFIDPDNRAIRTLLQDDLRAPVDAPQRIWAVQVAASVSLSADVLLPPLQEMLARGNDSSLLAAFATIRALDPKIDPQKTLAGALRNRLQTDPAFPHLADNTEILYGILQVLPPAYDPATDSFITQQLERQPEILIAALNRYFDGFANVDASLIAHLESLIAARKNVASKVPLHITLRYRRTPIADLAHSIATATSAADRNSRIVELSRDSWNPDPKDALLFQGLQSVLLAAATNDKTDETTLLAALDLLARTQWTSDVERAFTAAFGRATFRKPLTNSLLNLPPAALPFLVAIRTTYSDIDPWALNVAIASIGAKQPIDLNFLAPHVRSISIWDWSEDLVPAIAQANGTNEAKADLLLQLVRNPKLNARATRAALAALGPLDVTSAEIRSALLASAYGSPVESIRTTARQTLKILYP